MKKLSIINENIFDGIGKRSKSGVVRKEDKNNIPEIKWIDFGDNFKYLVADRYFSMQNNFIFNYEEICDFPFGNGIRLFNRSEFDDFMLFLHVREKNDDMIVFNDKNNIVLKGNECDGYHSTWVKEEENTLLIGEINTYRNDSTFASNNKMYPVLLIKNK